MFIILRWENATILKVYEFILQKTNKRHNNLEIVQVFYLYNENYK